VNGARERWSSLATSGVVAAIARGDAERGRKRVGVGDDLGDLHVVLNDGPGADVVAGIDGSLNEETEGDNGGLDVLAEHVGVGAVKQLVLATREIVRHERIVGRGDHFDIGRVAQIAHEREGVVEALSTEKAVDQRREDGGIARKLTVANAREQVLGLGVVALLDVVLQNAHQRRRHLPSRLNHTVQSALLDQLVQCCRELGAARRAVFPRRVVLEPGYGAFQLGGFWRNVHACRQFGIRQVRWRAAFARHHVRCGAQRFLR
jgi:hypothetical protein